jgi:hypothetical protein
MKTYYEKIEIHSEADLPKKDGKYICHWIAATPKRTVSFESKMRMTNNILNIDWYLLPLPVLPGRERMKELARDFIIRNYGKLDSPIYNFYFYHGLDLESFIEILILFASELGQSEGEDTESKYPTSDRDFTMTDKIGAPFDEPGTTNPECIKCGHQNS